MLWGATATSCILGFQSAQIKFKAVPSTPFASDVQITISSKDSDVLKIKDPFVKFSIPEGSSSHASSETTITWSGFHQDIKDAEFKVRIRGGDITKQFTDTDLTIDREFAIDREFIIKTDIKAGKLNEIVFNPRD